jgi:transposase
VHVTLKGYICGESHHRVQHSDATVAALRADVAAGMSIQVAALKHGVLFYTARQWVRGVNRPGPARVVVRRRKVVP